MPCIPIKDGVVCINGLYDYEGFLFKHHRYLGPTLLVRRTLQPWRRSPPKRFWEAYDVFWKLSDEEKAKHIWDEK